jgi:uncharacterized protein (DUF2141 family)
MEPGEHWMVVSKVVVWALAVTLLACPWILPERSHAQASNDPAANNTITLKVTGIQEAKGRMACALFWENKGFPRKHRRALRRTWVDVEGDTVKCVFKRAGLGEYAASVFLDLNENGKLDTNAIGGASEPWGVSKNVTSKRQGPDLYKDAKFKYEGGPLTLPIELRYE